MKRRGRVGALDGTEPVDVCVGPSAPIERRSLLRRVGGVYRHHVVRSSAALLRREGLFSSQLRMWRTQYQAGIRRKSSPRRGPTARRTADTVTVARLERENAQLRGELARAELVITLPKKLASLLTHPATRSMTTHESAPAEDQDFQVDCALARHQTPRRHEGSFRSLEMESETQRSGAAEQVTFNLRCGSTQYAMATSPRGAARWPLRKRASKRGEHPAVLCE